MVVGLFGCNGGFHALSGNADVLAAGTQNSSSSDSGAAAAPSPSPTPTRSPTPLPVPVPAPTPKPAIVWLSPADPSVPGETLMTEAQFMTLFRGNLWPQAQSKVQVMGLNIHWIAHAPAADVQSVVNWTRANHVKISVAEGTALETDQCGNHEGYQSIAEIQADIDTLQSYGIELDILSLDEPLFFGHYWSYQYDSSNPSLLPSCNYSIAQVVSQTLTIFNLFKAAFPGIQLHSFEPIDSVAAAAPATWQADLTQFIEGLSAGGAPLQSLQDDADFSASFANGSAGGSPTIASLIAVLAKTNTPFGLFVNSAGLGNPDSDAGWMAASEEAIQTYMSSGYALPTVINFASWGANPSIVTPETNSNALTFLIDYWFSAAAMLPAPQPFVQLYNNDFDVNDYTGTLGEITSLLQNPDWVERGRIGAVYLTSVGRTSLVPLYQFYNATDQDNYFSTSQTSPPAGYVLQGISCYVFSDDSQGGIPVYSSFNNISGKWFYEINAADYATLPSKNMTQAGIAFYIMP